MILFVSLNPHLVTSHWLVMDFLYINRGVLILVILNFINVPTKSF
jgi:hypothetical protein